MLTPFARRSAAIADAPETPSCLGSGPGSILSLLSRAWSLDWGFPQGHRRSHCAGTDAGWESDPGHPATPAKQVSVDQGMGCGWLRTCRGIRPRQNAPLPLTPAIGVVSFESYQRDVPSLRGSDHAVA